MSDFDAMMARVTKAMARLDELMPKLESLVAGGVAPRSSVHPDPRAEEGLKNFLEALTLAEERVAKVCALEEPINAAIARATELCDRIEKAAEVQTDGDSPGTQINPPADPESDNAPQPSPDPQS